MTIAQNVPKLTERNPSAAVKDLMEESGVSLGDVSVRTAIQLQQWHGYFLIKQRRKKERKKGLLAKRIWLNTFAL